MSHFKVLRSEPGLLIGEWSMPMPYQHIDGDLVLKVQWSDDDDCYVARYEATTGCIGVGNTVQDALAHLCGALLSQSEAWRELYEQERRRAQGDA